MENCHILNDYSLNNTKKIIKAWLITGLNYDEFSEIFDNLLLSQGVCREMIFPHAIYPSMKLSGNENSIRMIVQQSSSEYKFEKKSSYVISEILEIIHNRQKGIFPYYSRRVLKTGKSILLLTLISRITGIYIYVRNQDSYYEIDDKTDRGGSE